MPMTFPLYYTSFYNETKEREKEFLSEDEIDVYIKYNRVSFSILNHEKKSIFFDKILSKKMLKQAFADELDNFIGKPSKIQIVKIFNKIYNKYCNTSYLLENE